MGEELPPPELGQHRRPVATAATAAVGTSLRPGQGQSLAGRRGPLCPQTAGKDKVLPERVSVDGGEASSHDLALPTRDVGRPLPTVCPFLPCPSPAPGCGHPDLPFLQLPFHRAQEAAGRVAGLLGGDWSNGRLGRKPLPAAGSDTPLLPLLPAETLSGPACSPAGGGICAPAGGEGLASGGENVVSSLSGGALPFRRGAA